jgi:hypothetical protein
MNSALKSNERVGFITGLNSPSLLRAVVWEFVYSFENIVQFAGRLARVRGQTGTCTFVTWEDAIQQYSKGDRDSLEVASALRDSSPLQEIISTKLHLDPAIPSQIPAQPQQTLATLKAAIAGVKW